MNVLRMMGMDLAGKKVLIRQDLNVPLKDGKVADTTRLRAALPTLQHALSAGAKVSVMSHLGRPSEGVFDPKASLAPIVDELTALLSRPVRLQRDWLDGFGIEAGEIVVCENVRFNVGEKADDAALAKKMAALCDVFVMDAFGTAHRAQASTHGVARFAPLACAGPLLVAELDALGKALQKPARPMVAIVGGSKVSTKLTVLESLSKIVDRLICGGGIANTFIAASGFNVGASLYEKTLVDEAKRLMTQAKSRHAEIPVPVDVVVSADPFDQLATASATLKPVSEVLDNEMILDIGSKTSAQFAQILQNAGTIIWNGPVGVFEYEPFGAGTKALSEAIAHSRAFSIAGGGDTLAAISKYGIADKISYISTGGGAFLEFLEGKTLPAVAILEQRAKA